MVSIIIPTYNEAGQIKATLEAVFTMSGTYEVLVVDGGSSDGTLSIIRQFPKVRLYAVRPAERAFQMNCGARQSAGQVLWFLHADTRPGPNALSLIEKACAGPGVSGGSLRLVFDQDCFLYRLLASFTHLNCPLWTFGDQGIFVKKNVFDLIGGYADLPILEDLELQLRLRRQGKFVKLPYPLITSARRYHQNGILRELFLDTCVVIGYFLGIAPRQLKQWYQNRH